MALVYVNPPSGGPISYPDIESACNADSRADRHLNSDPDVGPSGDVRSALADGGSGGGADSRA